MKRRGIVMVSTLFIVVMLVMMTAVVLENSSRDLGNAVHFRDRQRALELARGGLNEVLYRLTYDHGLSGTIQRQWADQSYRCSFDPATPAHYRSINNLHSSTPVGPGVTGKKVGPGQAEIVVVARVGRTEARLRALADSGLQFQRSIGAVGTIQLENGSRLSSILSLADPRPADGGIYSEADQDGAIRVTGALSVGAKTHIESPRGDAGLDYPAKGSLPAGTVRKLSSLSTALPEFDVQRTVTSHLGNPAPQGVSVVAGVSTLPTTTILDSRTVNGDLVVNGDLDFSQGTLYVNGKLTVNGGIRGVGSVFVHGAVEVRGGTTLMETSQPSGAALFASGPVHFEALDAGGYLQSLASTDPDPGAKLQTEINRYRYALDVYANNLAATRGRPITPADLLDAKASQGSLVSTGGVNPDYYLIPRQIRPDRLARAEMGQNLPKLITALEARLGTALATDAKAQKILRALDHHLFLGRPGHWQVQGRAEDIVNHKLPGIPTTARGDAVWLDQPIAGWDDSLLMPDGDPRHAFDEAWDDGDEFNEPYFGELSWDHQWRAMVGPGVFPPDKITPRLVTRHMNSHYSFAQHHPATLSWLSRSLFQGLVYSGSDVTVDGNFTIVGALMSRGNVRVTDASEFICDQEYFKPRGASGPVDVRIIEEL